MARKIKSEKLGSFRVHFDQYADGEGGTLVDAWITSGIGEEGNPIINLGEHATKKRALEHARLYLKQKKLI